MQTIAEIVEAARRLSDEDRRRLVETLQGNVPDEQIDEHRRDAMSSWLSLAGIFHSTCTDVSVEKYKHLADVYDDKR